jgi:hypothetical protein
MNQKNWYDDLMGIRALTLFIPSKYQPPEMQEWCGFAVTTRIKQIS